MVIAGAEGLGAVLARVRALRIAVVAGVAVALGIALVALFVPSARADGGTGSIQFTLTNYTGGGPASGGCMEVYDASQVMVGSDCAGAVGTYTVTGLVDGSYKVNFANFTGAAPAQWYSLGDTFATATGIALADGAAFRDHYELVVPFSVIGRVVDPSGNPLGVGRVEIWADSSPYPGPVASVDVRADGTFATGDARVPGWTLLRYAGFAGYANEWYHDIYWAPSWTNISPRGDRPFLVQTETMNLPEGVLTGTVSVPSTFTSGSACFYLYEIDPTTPWLLGTECGAVGGNFAFHNLYARTYALCVADEAVPAGGCSAGGREFRFYGGRSASEALATGHGFVVAEGGVTTATLAWGGTITSSPSFPLGASPATGCMEVWSAGLAPIPEGSDCAGVNGTYTVSGLDDRASHLVGFRDFNGFLDEWYADVGSMAQATPVSVAFGQSVELSVALASTPAPWGTISGDVTLPAGSPDDHVCVGVTDRDRFSDHVCTAPGESGYAISVPPRPVWLEFYTETPATAFQLYDNVAASSDATSVTVALGATRVVNAALADAAEVSGNATLSSGAVALDGCVDAYEADGDYVYSRCVNGSGHYVLDSLPAGDYRLFFRDFTGAGIDEFYGGTGEFSSATTITVAPGDAKVADMVLPRPGTLAGTVTRAGGGPALGGCAVAYDVSGDDPVRVSEGCVDASGEYSLQLPVGAYAILFANFHDTAGGALQDEWNADAATSEAAAPVTIGGDGVERVDASLASSATELNATLRSWDYWPAKGGCSRVYDDRQALVTERCNDATSTWTAAIPAGTYHVHFVGYWYFKDSVTHSLAAQWAHQKATFLESDGVVIPAGANTSVFFTLAEGETYSGTVAVPSGATADGWVAFYDYTTGALEYWTSVAPDGTYSIAGVVGGPHRVRFGDFTGAADEWYDNALSFGSAWWVGSGGDGTTATLDATLAPEAVIEGRFTTPKTFTSSFVCVTAWYSDGYSAQEVCGAPGAPFELHHLAVDWYRLQFWDGNTGESAWFSNQPSWETGTWVPVVAGQTKHVAVVWFTDVAQGLGFYNEIAWMADQGITTGFPDGTFLPDASVSRQAMAAFMYRFAGSPAFTPPSCLRSPMSRQTRRSIRRSPGWRTRESRRAGRMGRSVRASRSPVARWRRSCIGSRAPRRSRRPRFHRSRMCRLSWRSTRRSPGWPTRESPPAGPTVPSDPAPRCPARPWPPSCSASIPSWSAPRGTILDGVGRAGPRPRAVPGPDC